MTKMAQRYKEAAATIVESRKVDGPTELQFARSARKIPIAITLWLISAEAEA
jgi:hypothetical protein